MKVFLSYSRQDAEFVERLGQQLIKLGYEPWVDTQGIPRSGEDRWRRSIVKAIRDCDAVVLVLSPNSVQSGNVERELSVAAEDGKRLIPVMYRECSLPDGLKYDLAGLQRIDFTTLEFMQGVRQLATKLGPTRAAAVEDEVSSAQPLGTIPLLPKAGGSNRRRPVFIAAGVGLVAVLAVAIAIAISADRDDESTAPTDTLPTDVSTAGTTQQTPLATATGVTTAIAAPPDTATTLAPAVALTPEELVIAQAALKDLAHQREQIDYSKPSSGPCGTFGMIVREDRIEFFQWSGGAWADASALLVPNGDAPPIRVTSRDYTGDGVIDFLVNYSSEESAGGEIGGVFLAHDCTWGWADLLTTGGDVTKVIDALWYEDTSGRLLAEDSVPGGAPITVTLSYSPDDNRFVAAAS